MADNLPKLEAEQLVYAPKEAARLLGVSGAGLRRLASIYAELYGPLPRDESEGGEHKPRLWPAEAVERLQTARALVQANHYATIRDALLAAERGDAAPASTEVALPSAGELRRRIEALAALPGQVDRLEARQDELSTRQGEALDLLRALLAKVDRLERELHEAEARAAVDKKHPRWQFWRR